MKPRTPMEDAEHARTMLLAALKDNSIAAIRQSLQLYADAVQGVRLQVRARELITRLMHDPLDTRLIAEMKALVSRDAVELYGVAGQARMGKDTVGDTIRQFRPDLPKHAFGSRVKEVVQEQFGVTLDFIEEWKPRAECPPNFGTTMRQALQIVGDGFRTIRPSVWIDLAMREKPKGVFCDVRYLNEANALREHGGTLILVGRTSALSDDANPSERSLRELIEWFLTNTKDACVRIDRLEAKPVDATHFDWFIRNDSTLDDLRLAVGEVLGASIARGVKSR